MSGAIGRTHSDGKIFDHKIKERDNEFSVLLTIGLGSTRRGRQRFDNRRRRSQQRDKELLASVTDLATPQMDSWSANGCNQANPTIMPFRLYGLAQSIRIPGLLPLHWATLLPFHWATLPQFG
jgi:hypothetical protein